MATAPKQKNETEEKPCCGLVMPISSIDGCSEQHWLEVKAIITEAVESAGYIANLVSKSEEISVIQKTIIQNLYENPIVICDVSGKNPNVMFELGIRLAFDKPTIVIKDDATDYSFDTGSLLHLEYPRSLRYEKINIFKKDLKDKILATMKKANEDSNYSPFLKNYGTYTVAKLEKEELSQSEFIMEELRELKNLMIKNQNKLTKVVSNESKTFSDIFSNKGAESYVTGKIIDALYKANKEDNNSLKGISSLNESEEDKKTRIMNLAIPHLTKDNLPFSFIEMLSLLSKYYDINIDNN